jgi:hypothetical protein
LSIVANEQTIELTTNATNQYMAIMNFPLGISKRVNHNTGAEFHLYFGPFMSFIWRQTQSKLEYGNTSLSTDTIVGKIGNENTFIQLQEATYYTRQFLFNRGISFMIVHESDDISIRVFLYRGKLSTFSPSGQNADEYSVDYDIMFHGQAWITEPHTGLTLQTEIINARNNPKPYFSATLSFAILFSELGKRYATLRNNNLKGPN